VATTIAIAGGARAIAMARDGKHAYVISGNNLRAIDTATNAVSPPVALVNGNPFLGGMAVSPDGKRVYVVNRAFRENVIVVDTIANALVRRFRCRVTPAT
jgi:DNA-binding beta-propeller fold protein YncE